MESDQKKILLVSTGGTIEKTYSESLGRMQNFRAVIQDYLLRKLRLPGTILDIEELMAVDSLEMTNIHRRKICDAILEKSVSYEGMIVLHGTDTLEQTLAFCHHHVKKIDIPVVFTGAMKPLDVIGSDAPQNVIEALTAVKILSAGFYLSFHGQIFTQARKDKERGTFVGKSALS